MQESTIKLLESLGVTSISEDEIEIVGDDYWCVPGKLNTYLVHKDTNNVYLDGNYISIVQPPYGHTLKDILAVVMALKNDDIMYKYIPTLKKRE
jgi:hypothetical protein